MPAANGLTWDDYAEYFDGKVIKIDGIECTIRVKPSDYRPGYSTEIEADPTANGKRTAKYREKKAEYRDDWVMCWDGELPPELLELAAEFELKQTGKVFTSSAGR